MGSARISNLLGIALVVIGGCSLTVYGKYGGGSGTPEDPYQIRDANHMQAIGADANDWDKRFKLIGDVDLAQFTGEEFNIIGTDSSNPFTGVFDGNNHTISNFTYNSTGCFVSLFGHVKGTDAGIKNLGLIDPNVIFTSGGTGFPVGSLVGYLERGIVSGCYTEGGSVCSSEENVGGLVGWSDGTVSDCHATCSVICTGNDVGGLVGDNGEYSGRILKCYATGSVEGNNRVGGLVGDNSREAEISDCYATGSVDGNDLVGGLVGWNDHQSSIISNCYATGLAQGNSNVGCLVGLNDGIVNVSFFNIDTDCPDNGYGDPLTDAEMKHQTSFIDWDFINTWNIGVYQTYPYLRVYLAGDINKDGIVNFLDVAITANQWMEE